MSAIEIHIRQSDTFNAPSAYTEEKTFSSVDL